MVETTAQIETHIAATRAHLGANLDALEGKIKSAADWREHFQSRPMTLLGAAFAGGIALAMAITSRHGRRRPRAVRRAELARRPRGPHTEEVVTMLDDIQGALVGMAATKMKDVVGQVVPGFQEAFDRRQRTATPAAPASVHAQTH
jgi:hypothetical protein